MRGLFSGAAWGLIFGGVTLTGVSLLNETPAGNTPPAAPQVTAPQSAGELSGADVSHTDLGENAGGDDGVISARAGQTAAPRVAAPDAPPDTVAADTAPAAVPATADAINAPVAPATSADPIVDASAEEPVLPNPQSIAPQVPTAETDLIVATAPAAPPAPVVVTPETPADENATADDAPTVVAIIPETDSNLPAGDNSVAVNRLTGGETTVQGAQTSTPTVVDPALPAITRYAMQVENPEAKPLVSVVLIDDGSFTGAIPAVAGIPFPVTVMLKPGSANATEKMTAYRAAGIEVGVLAELPEGAQPADVEVYFEAAFAALPETTAVLDPGGRLGRSGNAVIAQAIAAVGQDGRGLVTASRGLNATSREATRAGVPAGVVYRDLDGEDQEARVIRRFMDQAAFRARQESGVILVGRIRADTISALILWGTANRAGQVALVPVSNVLAGP